MVGLQQFLECRSVFSSLLSDELEVWLMAEIAEGFVFGLVEAGKRLELIGKPPHRHLSPLPWIWHQFRTQCECVVEVDLGDWQIFTDFELQGVILSFSE